jgi:hypothetical protein
MWIDDEHWDQLRFESDNKGDTLGLAARLGYPVNRDLVYTLFSHLIYIPEYHQKTTTNFYLKNEDEIEGFHAEIRAKIYELYGDDIYKNVATAYNYRKTDPVHDVPNVMHGLNPVQFHGPKWMIEFINKNGMRVIHYRDFVPHFKLDEEDERCRELSG